MGTVLPLEQNKLYLVGEFTDHLIARNLGKNTIQAYRQDIEKLMTFFGPDRVFNATPLELQYAIKEFSHRGLQASSISRLIACWRTFYGWAVDHRLALSNPALPLHKPKQAKKLPNVISIEEFEKLVAGIEHPRDRALVELIYGAGLRVSECTALNISDVAPGIMTLRVLGKGAKERVIPFGKYAREAIDAYLTWRKERLGSVGRPVVQALFINRFGGRLTQRHIRRIFLDCGATAGIAQPVKPHTLRHSFATHMLQRGAEVTKIQGLLGHENIRTTQIYLHLSITDLHKEYSKTHPRA